MAETIAWQPDPRLTPFELDLATYFSEVLGA
jgi:hypothetical protein